MTWNDKAYLILACITTTISIIPHEFGHYACAKILGFEVVEFGIGMPIGKIPSIKIGHFFGVPIKFNLLFIIGAYCKIGDSRDNNAENYQGKTYDIATSLEKFVILIAGGMGNYLAAILLMFFYYYIYTSAGVYLSLIAAFVAPIEIFEYLIKFHPQAQNALELITNKSGMTSMGILFSLAVANCVCLFVQLYPIPGPSDGGQLIKMLLTRLFGENGHKIGKVMNIVGCAALFCYLCWKA